MKKLDFRHPAACGRPPWATRLQAAALIALQRSLPLRWSMRLSLLGRRLEMAMHPRRRQMIADVLSPLMGGPGPDKSLAWHVRMALLVRQMGTRTYAAVTGRSDAWLRQTLRPQGLEPLDALARAGRGAIVLGTHAGMTAWMPAVLTQLGFPLRLTQRKRVYPQTLMLLRRDGWLPRVLEYPDEGAEPAHLKGLHDLLKQGQWIQHTADYPDHRKGLTGRCFGATVRCRRAPWALGRLSGAPLLPVLVVLEADLAPRLLVGGPIYVDPDAPAEEAMAAAFQRYLDFLQTHLASRPWNLYVHLLSKSRVPERS